MHRINFVSSLIAVLASRLHRSRLECSRRGASAEEPRRAPIADGVVAFYFHGNVRCATCKKIEAYADEAVQQGFAEALEDGALTWRVVNIDEPENKHFVQDFQLVTRSVVLAEYRDGKVVRWENLDKVWQLVRARTALSTTYRARPASFSERVDGLVVAGGGLRPCGSGS